MPLPAFAFVLAFALVSWLLTLGDPLYDTNRSYYDEA